MAKREDIKKYSTKENEKFYIGHFVTPKKKLTAKQKGLREWHFHPESNKLFVNIRLGGERGLRKAVMDGVQMYFYPDKEGELFVDIDWMIDRVVLGPSQNEKIKELKEKIFEMSKNLKGDTDAQADQKDRERCG